jgi:hypothetical protein
MAQGAAVSHSVNNPGVCRTVTSMTVTYILNTSSHQSRDSTIICTKKCACAHTPTCQSADSYRSHHMKPSTRSVMGACHPRIAVSPAISGFWVLPLRSCRQLVALALVGYCLSQSPWSANWRYKAITSPSTRPSVEESSSVEESTISSSLSASESEESTRPGPSYSSDKSATTSGSLQSRHTLLKIALRHAISALRHAISAHSAAFREYQARTIRNACHVRLLLLRLTCIHACMMRQRVCCVSFQM